MSEQFDRSDCIISVLMIVTGVAGFLIVTFVDNCTTTVGVGFLGVGVGVAISKLIQCCFKKKK